MNEKEIIAKARDTFLEDEELYNGLVASIESALIESPATARIKDLSVLVADRILGK